MRIELFVLLIVLGIVARYRRQGRHASGVPALAFVAGLRAERSAAKYQGRLTRMVTSWDHTGEIVRHAV